MRRPVMRRVTIQMFRVHHHGRPTGSPLRARMLRQ